MDERDIWGGEGPPGANIVQLPAAPPVTAPAPEVASWPPPADPTTAGGPDHAEPTSDRAAPSPPVSTFQLDDSFVFGVGAVAARGPSRGVWKLLIAALVIVALAVAAFAYVSSRPQEGTALALSMPKGQQISYRMTMSMQGSFSFPGASQGFDGSASANLGWKVLSVDANGIATVQVTISHISGSMNGEKTSVPGSVTKVRIAPDGRVLSTGDLSLFSSDLGSGVPGNSLLTPVLADHPVQPGDTWSTSYQSANPYGSGSFHYTTTGTLVRYENDGGHRTAVVVTTTNVPFDGLTIDFDKLAGVSDVPKGARIVYSGSMTVQSMSWVDTVTKQMDKGSMHTDFHLGLTVSGLGSEVPDGTMVKFEGTMTMQLTRI